MKGKKTIITQEMYVESARSAAKTLADQGERLSRIGRFLTTAPDFSPETLKLLRETLDHMKEVAVQCKAIEDITVKRGHTYYDEMKEKLSEGTLRINRRENDMAAE